MTSPHDLPLPAGFHLDPQDSTLERWWDGDNGTDMVRRAPTPGGDANPERPLTEQVLTPCR